MRANAVRKAKELPEGLALIEGLTAKYAARRDVLTVKALALAAEVQSLKRKRIDAIRKAAAETKAAHDELQAAIEKHKGEFEKPKTRVFHNIKVGFRKLVGKLTWDDADKVVARIEKHFEDRADVLIKTTKTPVKDALAQLSGADLKKIGCSIGDDTDEPVIAPIGTDVEKLVEALLKDPAGEKGAPA